MHFTAMQLGLSENLSALVARRFATAKEAGHLVFSSTHLSILNVAGIPFQLRYCPALSKKPSNLKPNESSGPKPPKPDPFQDPSPDLLIANFPPENPAYALVLNKFPVIPNHFILATKEWKPQTDILERADLEATYACLKAWNAGPHEPPANRLFAFFNSGEDSGASQPHRHLQFLPVEAMRQGGAEEGWQPLIDILAQSQSQSRHSTEPPTFQYLPHLPFAHFALPLPPNPSAETVHSVYLALYSAAVAATEGKSPADAKSEPRATDGPASISYNLAMTLSAMMICPRRSETACVPIDPAAARDIADLGILSLNGTILAGTLMVKAEAEWDALCAQPTLLTGVLRDVGFSRTDSQASVL